MKNSSGSLFGSRLSRLRHSFLLLSAAATSLAAATVLVPATARAQNAPPPIRGSHDTIPDFAGLPTITSVKSGAWATPSTWNPARVPGAADVVRVAGGHLITLDGAREAGVVGVQAGGELRMGRTSRLLLTTGVVYPGGTFSTVVDAAGELVFRNTPLDLATDPKQYGNGLIVLGKLRLAGVDRRPAFARLGAEPLAGQDRLTLSSPVTRWQVGDKLYIAGTRQLPFPRYNWQQHPNGTWTRSDAWYQGANQTNEEVRTLRAILDSGRTLVLDRPLDFDHKGAYGIDKNAAATLWTNLAKKHGVLAATAGPAPVSLHDPAAKATWDTLFAEYSQGVQKMPLRLKRLGHVANLTRSFVIRSENPTGTRGHILAMGRADVDVRHVAFDGLGRTTSEPLDSTVVDSAGNVSHVGTNQIGRYAFHFHHVAGPTTPQSSGFQFTFYDNSVVNSAKWGVAIHNSHYGLLYNNVVVGWNGAGIVTEDGSETGNQIQYNFVAAGTGSGIDHPFERQNIRDFGHRGDGIWLSNGANYTLGNVVCNVRGGGITMTVLSNKYEPVRIPKYQGADTTVAGQFRQPQFPNRFNLPFDAPVQNNEVYACEIGLETWVKSPILIKDNFLWHDHRFAFNANEQGEYPQEAPRVENLTILGDVRILGDVPQLLNDDRNSYGVQGHHYWVINKWTNVDIQNYRVGMFMQTNSGEDANGTGIHDVDLTDFFFRNETNLVTDADMHYKTGKLGPSRFRVNNSLFAPGVGRPLHIYTPVINIGNDQAITGPDYVFLLGFQKMPGSDTQLFYDEQRPDRLVPGWGDQMFEGTRRFRLWGVAEQGLTNAQAWKKYGQAIAGGVAPSTLARPEFPKAYLCPMTNNPYPTKLDEHHFRGNIERVDGSNVAGWVWDADFDKTPVKVRIYVNNVLKATATAANYREDLVDAGMGQGNHGFWITTPAGFKDGVTRRWSFRTVFVNSADGREIETEFAATDVTLR